MGAPRWNWIRFCVRTFNSTGRQSTLKHPQVKITPTTVTREREQQQQQLTWLDEPVRSPLDSFGRTKRILAVHQQTDPPPRSRTFMNDQPG
eukprot:479922-Rhodomonas_salina.1